MVMYMLDLKIKVKLKDKESIVTFRVYILVDDKSVLVENLDLLTKKIRNLRKKVFSIVLLCVEHFQVTVS